jgi:tetratricopeptide (TPR) repeat protein
MNQESSAEISEAAPNYMESQIFELKGTKTVNFEKATQQANQGNTQEAVEELNKILENTQNMHPESLASAHFQRAILHLAEGDQCDWAEALSDLYETTKIATQMEKAIPNENFNLPRNHFSHPHFMKANQIANQIITWMRNIL